MAAAAAAAAASGAMDTAGTEGTTKLSPQYSVVQRVKFTIMAFTLQKVLIGSALFFQGMHDRYFSKSAFLPDIIKAYPAKKSLPIRYSLPIQTFPLF
jgi:hypothetical protein